MQVRLFDTVLFLLEGKRVSATTLSDFFSVSRRTICRDLQLFLSSSVPVFTEQGRMGGLYLKEQYLQYYQSLSDSQKRFLMACLQGLRDFEYSSIDEVLEALQFFFSTFFPI